MRFPRLLTASCLALAATGCGRSVDDGDIDVSVIGTGFRLPDPDRTPMTDADRMLASATTQGLVSLDENGQVEPALAESWLVTPDGLSTVFRVRAAQWRDGSDIVGADVAASLQRGIARDSRNPYAPLLTSVDAVIGMTGRVVEVRLKSPRPNLLQLLSQPEFGIRRNGSGVGMYRVARLTSSYARLVPVSGGEEAPPVEYEPVALRAERPARAIARFVSGGSELVSGGTLADWPYVRAATIRPGRLRIDPVQGLFGFAITGASPLLDTASVREALAMAIDRDALADAVGLPGWATREHILPAKLDSADLPTLPDWSGSTFAQRRADARARIAAWRGGRKAPRLRVALPAGHGMRLLFAQISTDWRAIGVSVVAVPVASPDADLRLIDAVAPNVSANWYLTSVSCAAGLVCDTRGDIELAAARSADDLADRATQIAGADRTATARASFIALGSPFRWSLVDPRLTGWKENIMGSHPLHKLRPLRVVRD